MARPPNHRQDTFDLREQILGDEPSQMHAHADAANHYGTDDEEHSVLEDDSEGEENEEYLDDDDDSSSLSVPNESIDFDLVYAFHSFAATVDGQANVVKGDSLFLMDDSNSYWWLVRVLKTQEVGYIPAENIETPFERLARLNKHRNVDLASATQAELQDNLNASHDRLRNNLTGTSPSPNAGKPRKTKGVLFTPTLSVHRYLPAVWREDEMTDDEDVEWDDEGYEDEDEELANEQMQRRREEEELGGHQMMEPDDPMQWAADAVQQRQQAAMSRIPDALQPASVREQQQQAALRAQQHQQWEQQQREQGQKQQQQQQPVEQRPEQQTLQYPAQLQPGQSGPANPEIAQPQRDPFEETETRKLTVTPTIAREADERPAGQPYLPSALVAKQQSDDSVKRRLEEEAAEEARKKQKGKMPAPVSSAQGPGAQAPGKLRKNPSKDSDDDGKDKKKKGVFGSLFSRRKDKKKDGTSSITSMDSSEYLGRGSDDARSLASSADGALSPVSVAALQQQQQAAPVAPPSQLPSTPDRNAVGSTHVSPLANTVRQRDQQQQALYQQYLNRSPSSPPEAQPSYGLQSASAVMPISSSSNSALGPPSQPRQRPGSLILSTSGMGMEGPGVPELSVVRVFAGKHLQTEATFKTVLLNASTTSGDLVKQAIQRFRLPAGEDASDYYLTIKQVEGGASAVLRPEEHPLVVFENLVVESLELPKVKRSSVGSISSVVSNLSMHPAISKLPMNDFTDDSAVKFYLNRRSDDGADDSLNGHDGEDTLVADSSHGGEAAGNLPSPPGSGKTSFPGVSGGNANVTPERFTSPSVRFPLQLVIYPDDLPDDMCFHPTTEAIVFKNSLRDSNSSLLSPTGVSSQLRRKVFIFPKNITVAEVIELGLERFGILEGVVDGGDEVEDKYSKRSSSSRVRYTLVIDTGDGRERELSPSSRVIEAFPRPPALRTPERQGLGNKRRSLDAVNLLGNTEDVQSDDPIFVLRRAVSYRPSTSKNRTSAPLDELALANLHRESRTSDPTSLVTAEPHGLKPASSREIIAAQRAATRANQKAILSAQTNSVRGMDVLLPGNAVLRSSRYEVDDRMRYSYVEPDGETYDISDIVEEEWKDSLANRNNASSSNGSQGDLLESVLAKSKGGNLGDQLDRVLNKIKNGKDLQQQQKPAPTQLRHDSLQSAARSLSPTSQYSDDVEEREGTPGSAGLSSRFPNGTRQSSGLNGLSRLAESSRPQQKKPVLPKDDFGITQMMAIIECKALPPPKKPTRPVDPADEMLFGTPVDLASLHPLARDIYASGFKQLEEMDKVLDSFIRPAVGAF